MKKNPRQCLLDYMQDFFVITARPDETVGISLNAIADFCDQLRRGCKQDLERLILRSIEDAQSQDGKLHLRAFGEGIHEGGDIELWGLPDCQCDRVDCVYCGPRIASRTMSKIAGG
jgi:hypothetical protein